MNYLNKRTTTIDAYIKSQGYNLITIWEHEFDKNKDRKVITPEEFDLVEPSMEVGVNQSS